ncbi:hypothetical protein CFC21_024857 [Triticum aestivum]|uniref:Ribosomal protein L32 n=2 Tax=Triticum aestivum TaxID=4565 RepID=A0A3B6CDE4_WHEAT|nr:hypothetical protein CFC21_024857 [Triticum aestivum]
MAVKTYSKSKKCIRKNTWNKQTYFSIVQSYSLIKSPSFSSGNEHRKQKCFHGQTNNYVLE